MQSLDVVDKSSAHWSKFWSQGHLTSLPYGFTSNYDGEFVHFWNKQFALLNNGDCVWDVCSGNGSIALLAQDFSQAKNLGLRVKAIDAADINITSITARHREFARHVEAIEFIPNTRLEDISAEPQSVSLVASQYGIEYTRWEQSARNINRVLKHGGYFSMICHSLDSKIVNQMELQHEDYARLCSLDIFARPIEIKRDPESLRKFIFKLDHTLDEIHAMFKKDRSSAVLANLGRELENILKLTVKDVPAGLRSFMQFRQGVNNSYAISQDLLDVNRKLRGVANWYEVFVDEGLELIESGDIHHRSGENAGKFYQFRKTTDC